MSNNGNCLRPGRIPRPLLLPGVVLWMLLFSTIGPLPAEPTPSVVFCSSPGLCLHPGLVSLVSLVSSPGQYSSPVSYCVLDAREGKIARLEVQGAWGTCTFLVPACVLPAHATEGDILTVNSTEWVGGKRRSLFPPLSVDHNATDAARNRLEGKLHRLRIR